MYSSNRRQFLTLASAAALAGGAATTSPLAAAEDTSTATTAAADTDSRYNPRPAIAAYSFRKHFSWSRGKAQQPLAPKMDLRGFIDFCAAQRAAAELTTYFFPPEIHTAELLDLKRYAFRSGVTICGTAVGNRFDEYTGERLEQDIAAAEQWIDRTALLGGSHIRLFAGKAKTLADAGRFAASVAAVQRCARRAAERGVMIGLENHGGITAETLLRFVDAVDSDWVGINLDTGNFPTEPYKQLRACAPRAVHVQWKVAIRDEQGKHNEADFERLATILRDVQYSGFVAMEYEEPGDAYQATADALQRMKTALGV
ncbi:sugar phosphate isomerase/epimerase family protein [Roseimaritima ulvae]|uniref:Xylose isomerase-like TIM barrel n=1 Tax=Roseimaritima ulvae TaxID=980254 RepID=A0A5B9QYR4_9BACT|nr:sugar phosphate isomerase/epimerase family protein [Roseimaritima ulvae]QEG42535.1 Xylose isomerase-like TIM barrel [Roseimaritima ulvae]